jgi:hypothetical protein
MNHGDTGRRGRSGIWLALYIFSLYEQGWEKENNYRTRYLKLVRFDLDWVAAP